MNRRLSLIPAPFIAAQPGFRSKLWAIESETGEFTGYYEWDTATAAKDYQHSFPLRLLKRRAAAGTFSFEA